MKTLTKEVYYCEFCKKHGLSKWQMVKHERFCSHNPVNIAKCSDCKNVGHEEKQFCYDGEMRYSQAFTCTAKGCGLIPLKAQRKGLPKKYPATFEDSINMPCECDLYQQIDNG